MEISLQLKVGKAYVADWDLRNHPEAKHRIFVREEDHPIFGESFVFLRGSISYFAITPDLDLEYLSINSLDLVNENLLKLKEGYNVSFRTIPGHSEEAIKLGKFFIEELKYA